VDLSDPNTNNHGSHVPTGTLEVCPAENKNFYVSRTVCLLAEEGGVHIGWP
jgi:hypothetical protein